MLAMTMTTTTTKIQTVVSTSKCISTVASFLSLLTTETFYIDVLSERIETDSEAAGPHVSKLTDVQPIPLTVFAVDCKQTFGPIVTSEQEPKKASTMVLFKKK